MNNAAWLGSCLLGLLLTALPACGDAKVGGDTTQADANEGAGNPDASLGDIDAAPTDADTEIRFIAMGDTGTGNSTQLAVGQAVATLCADKGCDLVVLLGDNFYDSGVDSVEDPLWNEYFELPYKDVGPNIPFYAVMGNHDYGGDLLFYDDAGGIGNEFDKAPIEVEYTDHSDKWNMPATFYTLRFGNVGFMMLDTNSIMWSNTDNGDQEAWYAAARAELDDLDWVFGAGHHPYLSNGKHGNAGSYESLELGGIAVPNPLPLLNGGAIKDFFDTFVCGSVDVYFSGHDHNRQWVEEPDALCGAPMIVSGAGGKYTDLESTANSTLYEDDTEGGFAYVVVKGKELTLQFYDAELNVDFEKTISLP